MYLMSMRLASVLCPNPSKLRAIDEKGATFLRIGEIYCCQRCSRSGTLDTRNGIFWYSISSFQKQVDGRSIIIQTVHHSPLCSLHMWKKKRKKQWESNRFAVVWWPLWYINLRIVESAAENNITFAFSKSSYWLHSATANHMVECINQYLRNCWVMSC